MTTTTSNSQNVTLVASTEQHVTWAEWFGTIVIENLGSTAVWVDTSGGTVSASETGADCCPANSSITVANRQGRPAWFTPNENMTASTGATPQQSQNGTYVPASGYGTYVSLISTGTPQVVVSPM